MADRFLVDVFVAGEAGHVFGRLDLRGARLQCRRRS